MLLDFYDRFKTQLLIGLAAILVLSAGIWLGYTSAGYVPAKTETTRTTLKATSTVYRTPAEIVAAGNLSKECSAILNTHTRKVEELGELTENFKRRYGSSPDLYAETQPTTPGTNTRAARDKKAIDNTKRAISALLTRMQEVC